MCLAKDNGNVWKERWSILDTNLENLAKHFAPESVSSPSRKATIYRTLKCLQAFAGSHFCFFHEGFNETGPYQLEKSRAHPPDYVRSIILLQAANDMELIERAADQRQPDGPWRDVLEKTDLLAREALQPAMDVDTGLFLPDTTVVTYFQKSTSVRLIPYAPIAFIGLPYTAVGVPQDLLAIPHEVAHYVYRHGVVTKNGNIPIDSYLQKALEDEPFWLRNWLEEIFADVYGCLVGGPVMALDFQDLKIASSGDEFSQDYEDKEDPAPLLRPDIYSKTLKAKSEEATSQQSHAKQWERLAEQLHEHWRRRRRQRLGVEPSADDGDFTFTTVNSTVKLRDAMSLDTGLDTAEPLNKAINLILNEILVQMMKDDYSKWSGDADDLAKIQNITPTISSAEQREEALIKDNEALSQLYDKFDQYQQSLDSTITDSPQVYEIPEEPVTTSGIAPVWTAWVKKHGFFGRDEYGKGLSPPEATLIPEKQWKHLISSRYWVTRGPQGNPTGT